MTIDRLDRYARCFRDTVHRSLSVAILQECLARSLDNSASLPFHQRSFRIIGARSFHQCLSAFLLAKTDAFLPTVGQRFLSFKLCRPRSDSVWTRWATNLLRLLAND